VVRCGAESANKGPGAPRGGRRCRCALCELQFSTRAELRAHYDSSLEHEEKMAAMTLEAEKALASTERLNAWLVQLQKPEAATLGEARAALKRVYINIYDLLSGRMQPVFETLKGLRKYSSANSKIFPLAEAKSDGQLKLFLKKLF